MKDVDDENEVEEADKVKEASKYALYTPSPRPTEAIALSA
jgi:hypothetical protein